MFRGKFQQQRLSILFSCGKSPLELWEMHVKNGNIRRVVDEEVISLALEIIGTNVSTTYIFSPKNPRGALGICLPFMIMIIKNMKRYFTFEITILDDQNMHRRFRASNFQSVTRVRPFGISMPICLGPGWNQVQFNLAEFTRRAYGTNYVETTRMQIHANCRLRRVYFSDRLYTDDELPEEYKLQFPSNKPEKSEGGSKQSSKTSLGRASRASRASRGHGGEYGEYGEESLGSSAPPRTPASSEGSGRLSVHVPLGRYEEETDEGTEGESDADTERKIKEEGGLGESADPQGEPRESGEGEETLQEALPGDDEGEDGDEVVEDEGKMTENEVEVELTEADGGNDAGERGEDEEEGQPIVHEAQIEEMKEF
ncbi:cilia- and flagella-associated protein 20-like [Diachasma alloeum]|uniref:cilia- and flagella-associated protein 20-like n=1 Tax=Diachasma alloeum TaxID=454923 RepID=UPI0007380FC1|nr:cilia- and flagella-associated protein 20-like [Diachasma alloeum]